MEYETQLVRRSQQGDLDAFNQLVEIYQGHVYNLSYRFLSSESAAADATQETFISAYRAMKSFRGGNFRSWLLRIAANACKDMLRSTKARPALSLNALEEDPTFTPPADPGESPDDYVSRMELGAEIQHGLNTLPEDQKLALVLIDVQGYSYEEAASIMRTNLGTVKSRLSRARQHMKAYLRQRPELLPAKFRLDG